MDEIIDIVDEDDNVVGQDTRTRAHALGLLHREVWLWLFNPELGILLQRRSLQKDRYPGRLGTSIAGHVPTGKKYHDTVVREAIEEASLHLKGPDLIDLGRIRTSTFDALTNTHNETFKWVYAYPFLGNIDDIPLEKGEIDGFEWWPIARLLNPTPNDGKRFAEYLLSATTRDVLIKLWKQVPES